MLVVQTLRICSGIVRIVEHTKMLSRPHEVINSFIIRHNATIITNGRNQHLSTIYIGRHAPHSANAAIRVFNNRPIVNVNITLL